MSKKSLDEMTKPELLDEVTRRNKAGGDLKSRQADSKEDILAELQLDTESQQPERKESNLPRGTKLPDLPDDLLQQAPQDHEYTDGVYKDEDTGEEYHLCIHKEDGYGRTHSLKNQQRTWQGTKAEFKAKFEKA